MKNENMDMGGFSDRRGFCFGSTVDSLILFSLCKSSLLHLLPSFLRLLLLLIYSLYVYQHIFI